MSYVDRLKAWMGKLRPKYDIDGDRKLSDREIRIATLVALEKLAGNETIREQYEPDKVDIKRTK